MHRVLGSFTLRLNREPRASCGFVIDRGPGTSGSEVIDAGPGRSVWMAAGVAKGHVVHILFTECLGRV